MRDSKGKEYANSADRFANFNRISAQVGITNAQVGMVYLTKHLDSIQSYLKTGRIHSTERIRGRFVDAVTYLVLMAGMCEEVLSTPTLHVYGEGDTIIKGTSALDSEATTSAIEPKKARLPTITEIAISEAAKRQATVGKTYIYDGPWCRSSFSGLLLGPGASVELIWRDAETVKVRPISSDAVYTVSFKELKPCSTDIQNNSLQPAKPKQYKYIGACIKEKTSGISLQTNDTVHVLSVHTDGVTSISPIGSLSSIFKVSCLDIIPCP